MKHAYIAGLAILSLGISTQAMAKDADAIDVLAGNFMSVGTVNVKSLASNPLIEQAMMSNPDSVKGINELKALGIDYKKDISTVAFALDEKGHGCGIADGTSALKDAIEKAAAADAATQKADYNGVVIYSSKDEQMALLSDTRLVICEKADIKAVIDNAKAAKPKTLKERDSAIYNMYNITSKSADIRIGAKMTKSLKDKTKTYKLDDPSGISISANDIEAAALSINLAKGIAIDAVALTKSNDAASNGATILNNTITPLVSDPSLAQLGLGFLAKAYTITADKKNIKANIKLSKDETNTIMTLLQGAAQ